MPFKSIIPLTQSGTAEFSIPLPIEGWELPINVICTINNLTNAGIHQSVPVEINITLVLQNLAAQGAVADQYIYISSFNVNPTNAIEVDYLPDWDSPAFPLPWSYRPDNPARFSELWCTPTGINSPGSATNTIYEVFSDSQEVVLQDTGLLNLKIEPLISRKNPVDPMWEYSNLTYYDFKPIVSIPISIMSELDANRELMQEQQQNLQYEFDKLQAQQVVDQKTENNRAFSLTLFVLAFALIDIAVALAPYTTNKEKETEHEQAKARKKQNKINENLGPDGAIVQRQN